MIIRPFQFTRYSSKSMTFFFLFVILNMGMLMFPKKKIKKNKKNKGC